MKVTQLCLTVCNPMDSPWNSPGQNTGVGSLSLLQGIFPTQRSNPSLPHCRQILYQLRHKGSPRTLEWVAYPFSRRSSQLTNRTGVSCIAGGFFTNWAIYRRRNWGTERLCNFSQFTGGRAEMATTCPVFGQKALTPLDQFFKSRLHGNLKQKQTDKVKRVGKESVHKCS